MTETILNAADNINEEKSKAQDIILNDLNTMLMLITFERFKHRFASSEHRKRLGSFVRASTRASVFSECPMLFNVLQALFNYLAESKECFASVIHDIVGVLPPFIPELTRGRFIISQNVESNEDVFGNQKVDNAP